MPQRKDQYATVLTPGTKKVAVCSRRTGTRERLSVIATCTSPEIAEQIVDALNLRQGELEKLEAPALKTLEDVRASLTFERGKSNGLNLQLRQAQRELEDKSRELGNMRNERDRLLRDLAAEKETNAALAKRVSDLRQGAPA